MKGLFIITLCLIGSKAFTQTNDVIIQEKSSDWLKVTSTIPVSKPRSTTVKRKTTHKRTSVPKKDTKEEFDKTNSQVNRFKKAKKG